MKLLMYGVNKDTVMKEDVDKYLLNDTDKRIQMIDISQFEGVAEVVILSDDFRNEYFLYVDEDIFSHGEFLRYIAGKTSKTLQEVILETYSKFNEDFLRHLFELTTGYLSNPVGSFKDLGTAEKTLEFASSIQMGGPVVYKMFNRAIYLGYALKLVDEIKPLNQSQISHYILLLKEYISDFSKKNFLISGDDYQVYFLTKLLLFADAQTITIIQKDEEKSQLQFNQLKSLFNETELSRISPMIQKSLFYRLAKMDVAILNASDLNIFEHQIQEEVSVIRQTKKVQYLIDTAEDEKEDKMFPEYDFQYIDGNTQIIFNKEEEEVALATFEEELSIEVDDFMNFLQEVQADEENGITETKEMTY